MVGSPASVSRSESQPARASARRSQKSSNRPLSLQHRRAMIASAPATVQCIPARLSRVPMATLQPASTTPVEVQSPWARNSATSIASKSMRSTAAGPISASISAMTSASKVAGSPLFQPPSWRLSRWPQARRRPNVRWPPKTHRPACGSSGRPRSGHEREQPAPRIGISTGSCRRRHE